MHTSKLFMFCDRHMPGSLSQSHACLTGRSVHVAGMFNHVAHSWGSPSVLCHGPSLNQTMEETNSSRTKHFSLNQTITHTAAAVQAALEGLDLPCIYLAQHELGSIDIVVVVVGIVLNIIVVIVAVNLLTAVFRQPSCLRHPMAWHNRVDSFPSQMHSLGLLQTAMFKSQKGLPCKALPLQPLPLPRNCLSQSWGTGEISDIPTCFIDQHRLAALYDWSGFDSICVDLQESCVF